MGNKDTGAERLSPAQPEESVLYKVIQNNWLGFQGQVLRETGYPLPDFVIKEFEEYLCCGILAHGLPSK